MVMAIAYAPSTPDIIYLGSDTSQVWKSLDSGQSWAPINNDYIAMGARSLFVHPQNHNIVFSAATLGKTFKRTRHHSPYQGIYRSNDGGEHWKMVRRLPFYKQESCGNLFAIDSRTLDAAEFTIYVGTHDGELLVSSDSGATWKETGFKTGAILEIVESPKTPGALLIASKSGMFRYENDEGVQVGAGLPTWPRSIAVSNDDPDVVYAALGKYGVFKSIDGGMYFQPSLPGSAWGPVNDIEVSPVDADVAIFTRSGRMPGPYHTHDGGKHWQRAESINAHGLTQGGGFFFPSPVALHPMGAKTALTSSNGKARILKSTDGGRRWGYAGSGYRGGRLRDVVSLSQQSMIFGLTDHGAWRTDDGALTFASIDHPSKGGKSIGGGAVSGSTLVLTLGSWKTKQLLVSQDEGRSWKDTGLGGRMRFVRSHNDDDNVFYVDKYSSRDGGLTWIALSQRVMALDPADNDRLYALEEVGKTAQLMVSEDQGEHWRKFGSPLPVTLKSVHWLEVDPFLRSRLYAASGHGLWVFDSGKWRIREQPHGLLSDPFGGQNIGTVVAHPAQRGLIFAGKRSQGKGMANGLLYSLDHGESWQSMPGKVMSNTNIWSVNINPHDGIVYVGTSHGVYRVKLLEN
ncbi:MAG: hypothetical protein KZQ95_08185 [Candidatus Thiodiazotropha sp. (ex Epidulcina cf. delphinae)]|nr:hypothetical protein [Candidatus Thiodiazotropha sp. (ex Epidulcina cf. delphinae)]